MSDTDTFIRLKYTSWEAASTEWINKHGIHYDPKLGSNDYRIMKAINRWWAEESGGAK